jgi:hypothetical protein
MPVRGTSVERFREMRESGELSDDQEQVFEWLLEYLEGHENPPTSRELHQWLAVDKGNSRAQLEGPNLVKPRLTELKEKGLVEEEEKRECSVTGNKAYSLVPTEYQSSLSTGSSEESDDLVEVDGQKYVFDPREDPAVDVDEDPEADEDDQVDEEDGSEEEQKLLFDKGEVVG